jgi:hypothetical protein
MNAPAEFISVERMILHYGECIVAQSLPRPRRARWGASLHFSQRGLLAASRRVGGAAGKFRRFRNVETTSPG